LSKIIAAEEVDTREYLMKSPYIGGGIESNKISAIGLGNDYRKDSPWWGDNDGIFEFQ